jgi:hypothetical protein
VDEYRLMHINFKNLIHTKEWITDEPYVLIFEVAKFFYVEDERNPD